WKVEVFPNAIVEGKQLQRITRVAGPSRTAIFAGRLVPLKGLILALRAMKHLPQWRLLICGSGPDEKRLRKAAHRYGVSDRVHFLGWVPRGEVMRLMREEADVLLFPSFHDEAGLAVAEAVACGLPAVCIARGGPPLLGATAVHAVAPEATAEALAAAVLEVADTRPGPSAHGLNHRERLGEILSERGIAS
ncbi:MAG: glycosyltransferase, partial [Actinomycetota bacterium]